MDFKTRYNLMILCNECISAFNTAASFIGDDTDKYSIYERCYNKAKQDPDNIDKTQAQIAEIAKSESENLWSNFGF